MDFNMPAGEIDPGTVIQQSARYIEVLKKLSLDLQTANSQVSTKNQQLEKENNQLKESLYLSCEKHLHLRTAAAALLPCIEKVEKHLVLTAVNEVSARAIAKRTLCNMALESAEADCGEAVFAMLLKVRPTLILLDLTMPDMDGLAVLRMLKNDPRYFGIRVIMTMPTNNLAEAAGKCIELGAEDYCIKPLQSRYLQHRIERCLCQSSSSILVVDDDKMSLFVASGTIKQLGYSCMSCNDATKVFDLVNKHKFDLVLLDVVMTELLIQIKANPTTATSSIVMMSGVDGLKKAMECIKMGADDYFIKPFQLKLVRTRIKATLNKN
jgi:CheY-like chemotaxis protein